MSDGVLTKEELMELWRSVVGTGYSAPLLDTPDSGIEYIEQIAEQLAKVSRNINAVQQQMFIRPWSGQTGEPAGGARRAEVTLRITRAHRLDRPFIVVAGVTTVDQILIQPTLEGGVPTSMQRRYVAAATVVMMPGDAGPIDVEFVAERPGAGYNEPPPDTITGFVEVGTGLGNTGASVIADNPTYQLVAAEPPDTPTPDNIGSYVEFVAGANVGKIARVLGYANPEPGLNGGTLIIGGDVVIEMTSGAIGAFVVGEVIRQLPSEAEGILLAIDAERMVVQHLRGVWTSGFASSLIGLTSGALVIFPDIDANSILTPETETAEWRVLSAVDDFGVVVTNPASPTGGRSPFLDELGRERMVDRAAAEDDDSYRERVGTPADVVSPNALRRVANRVLQPVDVEVCLREVGTDLLPGFFYDDGPDAYPGAYDLDLVTMTVAPPGPFIQGEVVEQVNGDGVATGEVMIDWTGTFVGVVRPRGTFTTTAPIVGQRSGASATPVIVGPGIDPSHRFVVYLDAIEMRAFFMIGVPPIPAPIPIGGLFYDDAYRNAYDDTSLENFFDATISGTTYPVSPYYAAVWNAVNAAKEGGVRWQMYVEDVGCF